ncbi:MAG TPA: outer membrane beta-barrel protein [Flavobacteriales bacterium]|nr:outer membrane beta-barrel protein [Flavobacteriales bacterium]
MKRIKTVVAAFTLVMAANAQDSGFSAGLAVSLPMGDFGDVFSVGVGPSVGYDREAGDKGLLGIDLSYLFHGGAEETITKCKTLSLVGHYKYFISDIREGLYLAPLLGWSAVTYHFELEIPGLLSLSSDESTGGLTFGAGVGYFLSERIDLGLNYTIIRATEDGDATASAGESSTSLGALGIRAAYCF